MAAASRNPAAVDRFLSERRASRGHPHTHTRIRNQDARVAGGSFAISEGEEAEFLRLYYTKVFERGGRGGGVDHLTEKQLIDDGPLLVDVDLRYEPDVKTRQHTDEHVEDLVAAYMAEIDSLLTIPDGATLQAVAMHKGKVNETETTTKDGIHLVFGIKMPRATQLMLRKRMLTELACIWEGLPITNSWDEVLDEGVAKGSVNWQLYGSRKPGHQAYLATHHYTVTREAGAWSLETNAMERFSTQKMLPKLSARCRTHPSFPLRPEHRAEFEALTLPDRPARTPARANRPSRYDTVRSQAELDQALESLFDDISPVDYRLKETHEYTMVLPQEYYGPGSYNKWIRVGWALQNTSPKLFFSWIKFSAQPGGRATLQGPGEAFDWGKVPELFQMWREFDAGRTNGLTHRSILYWAKHSAKEAYERVRSKTIDFFIEQTISRPDGLEYDMANVLYNIYKDRFVCVSIKNNVWYEYRNHRWHESDSGTALRRFISTEMHQMYVQRVIECTHHMDQIEQADEDWENSRKRTKKLCDIADLLKKTAWKKNIMTEAKELFFDKDFHAKLDQDPYLMCFSNCVVDFKQKLHRRGQPDDYISKCANIEYVPFSDVRGTKSHSQVERFMRELFPNVSLRDYMYQHLASCLLGTNQNQTFNVYKGEGSNGKSKLVELMAKVLGEYKGTVPFALLTQKRSSIGSTSSEIVQLMGVRYAVMQEPSKGDKINEGIMKEITGGDPIQGRALFKDTVTFTPQFKLVVCTNNDFEIKSNDDGTWRRIRVCDFQSRFMERPYEEPDKCPKSLNPHQFKIDKCLDEKFEAWAPVLASTLVDIAFERQGHVGDCPEVMTSSDKYRERQDYLAEFVRDNVVRQEGGRIKKNELMEHFRAWYKDQRGAHPPQGREVSDFMTKRFGVYRNGWHSVAIIYDYEDEQDDPGTGGTA
jgi:P4 family phage/plasmid primase-like protien